MRRDPLAVLVGLLPVLPAPAATGSDDEPAGHPGEVLSSTPYTAFAAPGVPLPATAWKVTYESRTAQDRPVEVTGSVLVPHAPWTGAGERPLVGLASGSQGLADRCAASTQLAAGTQYESAVIGQLLARGWAVAVSDYQGIGTPGEHPYVVGQALGRNVLDSVRAARDLPAAGLSSHGPAAIYGYSEGGSAAGWAIQLQPNYAPDVPVTGAAVGAAPADFPSMVRSLNGGRFVFLIFYAGSGFDTAYPELRLSSHLNAKGKDVVRNLRKTCIADAIVGGQTLVPDYRHYVARDPFQAPDWQARLAENKLGNIKPDTPVLVGGARQDEVIPFSQNVGLAERWRGVGADVRFLDIPAGEHLTGGLSFGPPAIAFLAEKFGQRPRSPAPDLRAAVPSVPGPHTVGQR